MSDDRTQIRIDPDLSERLKPIAKRKRRSLTKQVEVVLENALPALEGELLTNGNGSQYEQVGSA